MQVGSGKGGSGQTRRLFFKAGGKGRNSFIEVATAFGKVTLQEVVFLLHVTRTNADDQATTRKVIDGGEFLGGAKGVTLSKDEYMGEQMRLLGNSCQPTQRCRGVIPSRSHRRDETTGDGGMVTNPEVVATHLVRSHSDGRKIINGCR
jgi:hypothetical protein